MARRDPWPGVPDIEITKFDDTYYQTDDNYWEIMFSWDNDFDQHVTVVHPVHGSFTTTPGNLEVVQELVRQANRSRGL